jgi:hypothetical protein
LCGFDPCSDAEFRLRGRRAEFLNCASAGFTRPAIAAISLGIVGRKAMSTRTGRNLRFEGAGNALTALMMGVLGSYLGAGRRPHAPSIVGASDRRADRDLIERHVDRVIIGPQAVEVRLTPSAAKESPELHRDELDASGPTSTPLMLPWETPAFAAVKGIVHTPTAAPRMTPEACGALLAAIAKARGWVEHLRLGRVATLAEIAECEGLGERHVRVLAPLAFVAPRVIAAIADDSAVGYATVTGLAQRLPDSWAEAREKAQSVGDGYAAPAPYARRSTPVMFQSPCALSFAAADRSLPRLTPPFCVNGFRA